MGKVKEFTQKISADIKDMTKKFPVTIIMVVITTLFFAIYVNHAGLKETMSPLVIFAAGTFFAETYFKSMRNRAIGYVLSALISFMFVKLIFISGLTSVPLEEAIIAITTRTLFAYLSCIALLIFYKLIKDSGLKFAEYLLRAFSKVFFATLIYGILAIGVTLLVIIFIELILNGNTSAFEFLYRIHILLFGLFYVLALMYAISEIKEKEVNAFIKGLIVYVMMPLVSISMLIIYIYILKIIILQDIPSNIIYRILVGIFIVALPTWIMAGNYAEKNKVIAAAAKVLPFVYMPFILLEIYSIGIRIVQYGITPFRYISAMFILFQISVLFFDVYKKREKFNYVFMVGIILILISTISPINLITASDISQASIIKQYLPEGKDISSLTSENRSKVLSAYNYLIVQYNADKYLSDNVKTQMKEYVQSGSSSYISAGIIDITYTHPSYYSGTGIDIDVTGYTRITGVASNYISNGNTVLYTSEGRITGNLQSLVNDMISYYKQSGNVYNDFTDNNNVFKLDDKHDLYITKMMIEYNQDTGEVETYIAIEGYVLTK